MPLVASKIVTAGDFKAVDADAVEDGGGYVMMTAAERTQLEQQLASEVLEREDQPPAPVLITDSDGRTMPDPLAARVAATEVAVASLGATVEVLEREDEPSAPVLLTDSDGRTMPTATDAASLRLDRTLDDAGTWISGAWNTDRIRSFASKCLGLEYAEWIESVGGDGSEYLGRACVLAFGDSGSARATTWPLAVRLMARDLGLAEVGIIPFTNGSDSRDTPAALSLRAEDAGKRGVWLEWSGTWTYRTRITNASPNTCYAETEDPSATVDIHFDDSVPAPDVLRVMAEVLGGAATAEYRFNGTGDWTSFTVPAGGSGGYATGDPWSIDLDGVPATTPMVVNVRTASAATLRLTVASALSATRSGLSVHKIAVGGGRMDLWAETVASPQWQEAIRLATSITDDPEDADRRSAPDIVIIPLGANDAGVPVALSTFTAAAIAMATVVRELWPYVDIVFAGQIDTVVSLGSYTEILRRVADEHDAAWVPAQDLWGPSPAFYARDLAVDGVHPNYVGGRLKAGLSIMRTLRWR